MNTSYFGKLRTKEFRECELNLVSIARGNKHWTGDVYEPLMPSWDLINKAHNGECSEEEYQEQYHEEVLFLLDPLDVYEYLGSDAILLCHEKYDDILSGEKFCHRHMVARWLEEQLDLQYGIIVKIDEL